QNKVEDFINLLGDLPRKPLVEELAKTIDVLETLLKRVSARHVAARADLKRLEAASSAREEGMTAEQIARFREDKQRLGDAVGELEAAAEALVAAAADLRASLEGSPTDRSTDQLVSLASQVLRVMQELSLVQ